MGTDNEPKTQEERVSEAVKAAKEAAKEETKDKELNSETEDEVVMEETIKEETENRETDNEEPVNEEAKQEETLKEGSQEEEAGKVKKFGKKVKKDKKDEKIEDLTDKLARSMAEFDNFRKRTEKEKSQMYEIGAKSVIEKILPIVDNFERGLEAVKDSEDPFAAGMEKIYKQLMTSLEELGVKPIEAVGGEFNPDFHNAVMHVEDENYGENMVAEEFQKGYMYRDMVVRHSMVKVAN
ncbi:MAG: nucleotide exchange factor GrpE [Lachnospiraceae bacterium]|jgi:molecular chaperone GrpE|nr:nucleotide exchange factor GrpE [Lachnospiraceae bacterium]